MYPLDVSLDPVLPSAMTTLADVKALMGKTDSADDALITGAIATASLQIEKYCNAIFPARTVMETAVPEDLLESYTLKHNPANTLTSITVGNEALDAADFLFMKGAGILRRTDGAPFATPGQTVVIVYVAGFSVVPPDVVHATKLLAQFLFNSKNRDGSVKSESSPDVGSVEFFDLTQGANGVSLPCDIAGILAPYVRYFGF